MEKDQKSILINKYGLAKNGYKYIPAGSEILKQIGQEVVLVEFKKDNSGNWTNEFFKILLESISDFDPLTMTYNCKYSKTKESGEKEECDFRMIPEGFSYGNPEETRTMKRILPISLHYQLFEDEAFFLRVQELYKTRDTMKLDYLLNIAKSKDQGSILKYSNNIGAAVKLSDTEYLWIRIHELRINHRNGTKYALRFANNERSWSMMIDSNDLEYAFEDLGNFKILDLAD